MEVLEAIKTRRSIGKYKTTPVDNKTIELVLDVAPWVTLRQNLRLSQGRNSLKLFFMISLALNEGLFM